MSRKPDSEDPATFEAYRLDLGVVSPLDCGPNVTEEGRKKSTRLAAELARRHFESALAHGLLGPGGK